MKDLRLAYLIHLLRLPYEIEEVNTIMENADPPNHDN